MITRSMSFRVPLAEHDIIMTECKRKGINKTEWISEIVAHSRIRSDVKTEIIELLHQHLNRVRHEYDSDLYNDVVRILNHVRDNL